MSNKMVKVKATMKLNLGHLEGMKEGEIAYFEPNGIYEVPYTPEIKFYIENGGLQLVEEYVIEDKPKEENIVKDIPKKKEKKEEKKGDINGGNS